ncbi:hypothetical protein OH720_15640 [Pseudomonas sp. WJP1]|uniref:hypothetical protein n=1 Tax=Pseudomonas sp. WJP1 TaxID=2986947 RepID=UPI002349ABFF|nr:hypothetical protein [Pseudomonas sp. WJP1]WCM54377.1 hypothetical protein OH720_15640 [Pseudomonas sp. WJP1]
MNTPKATATSAIRLAIDTLALPGYSVGNGQRLAGALERELGRLLVQGPLPGLGFEVDRIHLPRFETPAGERPERTGRRLAQLIARQLQGQWT